MAETKLRFGVGGIPLTTKGDAAAGVRRLRELGLEHMELEFVQSVFLKPEKAEALKTVAAEHDVTLSVHGSYYVNLAALERPKFHASVSRVVQAAKIGQMAGAQSVTYHTGFFQGREYADVKPQIIEGMAEIFTELSKDGATEIKIAPELTGKPTQVGTLEQLIDLVDTLQKAGYKQASLCIDFAHQYARNNGSFNTYDEFMFTIDEIAGRLGTEYLENLHIHISGITYTLKGESHHLIFLPTLAEYADAGVVIPEIEDEWKALKEARLTPNLFNWRDLLKALKTAKVGGFVVCESPLLELDSKLMQLYYQQL